MKAMSDLVKLINALVELDELGARRGREMKDDIETPADMLERLRDNAQLWAQEFNATAQKLGYSDMDEGWLIGWFANAIEYSHSIRRFKFDEEAASLRAKLAENERLRKALENWQEWWALPWQDKRHDVGSLNYLKGQKALAAHVGEGEKDGLE
jgi:hypothetical protein